MPAKITIILPAGRKFSGTLTLRDEKGAVMFSCAALGRAANHAGNPGRDALKYRGDTPAGKYALTFISHLPHPVTGIGDLWITLDPDNFYDTPARRAELNGRRGLGIHGGRGNLVFKPTHGCIRLLDKDISTLAMIAGKLRFTVEIKEG